MVREIIMNFRAYSPKLRGFKKILPNMAPKKFNPKCKGIPPEEK